MSAVSPQIEETWKQRLADEFNSDYFSALKTFLIEEKKAGFTIYPPGPEIFNAFNHTPFNAVKAVILGQDPYHGHGQAHGLSFSVKPGIKAPPSLVNIYKEIKNDLNLEPPLTGDLTTWANQGVLLLNTTLTVRAGQPASHYGKGWEKFTDAAIKSLSEGRNHLVFLLWGKNAQLKAHLIDDSKHLILQAAHPSPFSAHNGFFGCKHFSKTNAYLMENAIKPIDWSIK